MCVCWKGWSAAGDRAVTHIGNSEIKAFANKRELRKPLRPNRRLVLLPEFLRTPLNSAVVNMASDRSVRLW